MELELCPSLIPDSAASVSRVPEKCFRILRSNDIFLASARTKRQRFLTKMIYDIVGGRAVSDVFYFFVFLYAAQRLADSNPRSRNRTAQKREVPRNASDSIASDRIGSDRSISDRIVISTLIKMQVPFGCNF